MGEADRTRPTRPSLKAVILAGGRGTRLKPFTTTIPKPLVPLGDRSILEVLIGRLKSCGITDLVLCVNHMSGLIMAYFGDGSAWNVSITYSIEEDFLGTVAPIKLIDDLPDNFLVMNGDLLTDLDFRELYDDHMQNEALLTVATYKRDYTIDFGVLEIENGRNVATGFKEKPSYDLNVSMGVYVFNRELLAYVPDEKPFGFDDLMLTLLAKKKEIRVHPYSGYWLDIGRPEDFDRANLDIDMIDHWS
jgi:NDP-sugar pyrophosphorylase family protein